MILRGMSGESTWASSWGMSDRVLSGACLAQHLGHIVNNGQQSVVLHASVLPFFSSSIFLQISHHMSQIRFPLFEFRFLSPGELVNIDCPEIKNQGLHHDIHSPS